MIKITTHLSIPVTAGNSSCCDLQQFFVATNFFLFFLTVKQRPGPKLPPCGPTNRYKTNVSRMHELNVRNTCIQKKLNHCGLIHKAGFSCYPGKFKISLNKRLFQAQLVDSFLADFIAIVIYRFYSGLEITNQN